LRHLSPTSQKQTQLYIVDDRKRRIYEMQKRWSEKIAKLHATPTVGTNLCCWCLMARIFQYKFRCSTEKTVTASRHEYEHRYQKKV